MGLGCWRFSSNVEVVAAASTQDTTTQTSKNKNKNAGPVVLHPIQPLLTTGNWIALTSNGLCPFARIQLAHVRIEY
jgi:hypothetical protein